ncbi:hypothetical protein Tco_1269191, partial [Tanacetum coccineum]
MILKCFRDASSLRVNLAKSKLYGIGVNSEEVNRADVILNSGFDSLPFIYLGLQNISGVGLKKGIWDGIVSSSLAIDDTGVAFSHSFIKKDSDGDTTLFWEDLWDAYSK